MSEFIEEHFCFRVLASLQSWSRELALSKDEGLISKVVMYSTWTMDGGFLYLQLASHSPSYA